MTRRKKCDGNDIFSYFPYVYIKMKKKINHFVVRETTNVKFHHLVIIFTFLSLSIDASSLHPFRAKNKIKLICQKKCLLTNKKKKFLSRANKKSHSIADDEIKNLALPVL